MPQFPETLLRSNLELTPLDVYEAGIQGDRLSLEVFRLSGTYLGIALGGLVNVLNPEAIVVGGGLGLAPGRFRERLIRATREHIRNPGARSAFRLRMPTASTPGSTA